jgi:hypothetical protein
LALWANSQLAHATFGHRLPDSAAAVRDGIKAATLFNSGFFVN